MAGKPEFTVKVGAIQFATWVNETKQGKFTNVTIIRNYKNEKGEWDTTTSFKSTDLPFIALGINKVMEALYVKPDAKQSAGKGEPEQF